MLAHEVDCTTGKVTERAMSAQEIQDRLDFASAAAASDATKLAAITALANTIKAKAATDPVIAAIAQVIGIK